MGRTTAARVLFCFAAAALRTLGGQNAVAQQNPLERVHVQWDADGGGGNSIVGNWHQTQSTPDGGVIHSYWMFGSDGSFRESSVQVGGGGNGTRTQVWGHYQASPAANGTLFVKTTLTGRAPLRMCMPGLGCRPTATIGGTMQGYFRVQGNMFQTDGVMAQRDSVPPVMLQQLPATWTLQPPPPLPSTSGGSSNGNGGYNPPGYHVPGQGGTCDNLQQQRVCTVNGGTMYTDRNGCQQCRAPY